MARKFPGFGAVTMLALALLVTACASGGPKTVAKEGTTLVLVAGATGGTGQEIVDQALARGYSVRALVRDEAKARMLWGDRVQYAVGDVREPRSLRRAVKGVSTVISALGANVQRDPENSPELVDY